MAKVGQYAGRIHGTSTGPHKLTISNLNKQASSQVQSSISSELIKPKPSIYEQLGTLSQLKYSNSELIFPVNVKDNNILYEVIYRIKEKGFDVVNAILTSKIWKNEEDLYFSFPEFDSAIYKYNKFIEDQFDVKEVMSGLYKCKRCKSDKTTSFTVQLRSRDEGETTKVYCTSCNFEYKIG